jgi:hypothetical protein
MATADSARSRLRGVIAPTVTPFDDNGAISIPGVAGWGTGRPLAPG